MIHARLARTVAPTTVALAAVCASSPWWPGTRSVHVVAQALAPWAALAGLPVAGWAVAAHRRGTAAAGFALGAAGLAVQRWIRGRPDAHPSADGLPAGPSALGSGRDSVRVGHFNLWFDNRQPARAAATLAALDVDVLVLSEMTPSLNNVFTSTGLADRFEHRVDRSRRLADGMVVWSHHPLTVLPAAALSHERIRVRVGHPHGPIIVDGIHTQSPIHHARTWTDDLHTLAAPAPAEPAVMVGDFNAAWTHPRFRAVVAQGWRDVHRSLGRGTRNSWRIDHPPLPPFVRIDHALVNDGLDVIAIHDVDLPGSDHRGFVVTVRRR